MHCFAECTLDRLVTASGYWLRQYMLKAILQPFLWPDTRDNEAKSNKSPFSGGNQITKTRLYHLILKKITYIQVLIYSNTVQSTLFQGWTLKVNSSNLKRNIFYRELHYPHCVFTDKSINPPKASHEVLHFCSVYCQLEAPSFQDSNLFSHWMIFSTIKLFVCILRGNSWEIPTISSILYYQYFLLFFIIYPPERNKSKFTDSLRESIPQMQHIVASH